MQLLSQNWGLANPQIVEVPWAANLQFFEKLFDYINYLYVRKDRICSFSWKMQSQGSSKKLHRVVNPLYHYAYSFTLEIMGVTRNNHTFNLLLLA